jgi:hypothetical protein
MLVTANRLTRELSGAKPYTNKVTSGIKEENKLATVSVFIRQEL